MNVSVYIFGKLGENYTQYPDDYTREVFSEFDKNIKSKVQLMIHRNDDIIYYGYLLQLSNKDKYIGIALVFNGVMCVDVAALFKLFEDNITNWVVNGKILEFGENGEIISKVDKLYKTVSEFEQLSKFLCAQIEGNKIPFKKLPTINYAVRPSAVEIFSIEDKNEKIIAALNDYSNIYIYGDSFPEKLNNYSNTLRTLHEENENLKINNKKLQRKKNEPLLL